MKQVPTSKTGGLRSPAATAARAAALAAVAGAALVPAQAQTPVPDTLTTPPVRISGESSLTTAPTVKVALIRVRKITGLNPFSVTDVASINSTTAATAGPVALTVLSAIPFGPAPSLFINIDAAGTNTLTVTAALAGTSALSLVPAGAVTIYTVVGGFTLVSRTVANPVPEGTSVTFVVRRTADGRFFQIVVTAIGDITQTVTALSGSNCGTTAGACP